MVVFPGPIGVVGLGAMGLPMACTLAAAGAEVTGVDPRPDRRSDFDALGRTGDTVSMLTGAGIVVLSLPDAAAVETVVTAQGGLLEVLQPGAAIVDTSTVAPDTSRMLQAKAAKAGLGYVDAPVSGGAAGAATGQLLVMAGGSDSDIRRVMPVLQTLSREVVRCGGPGAGNVVKLINNLLCAAHLALAGEALHLIDRTGLDAAKALAALNAGSGRSGVTEVNLPRWVLSGSYDSGFTMGLMRKDVRLALETAEAAGAVGPLMRMTAELWAASAADTPDEADFNRMVARARDGGTA